jgi:hypothetical protein
MASSATIGTLSSSSLHPQQGQQRQQQPILSRPARKSAIGTIATASTPNLNSLYSAHSRLTPAAGSLARKASLAALTPGSLASIPDDTESYALHSVLNESTSARNMPPLTPGKGTGPGDDLAVGDQVDVPGNMVGTVRFVGSVAGRKGTFIGIELQSEYALRGKNSGEVDGCVRSLYYLRCLLSHEPRMADLHAFDYIVFRILPHLFLDPAFSSPATNCLDEIRRLPSRIHHPPCPRLV